MPRLKRIAKGNIVYHVLNRKRGQPFGNSDWVMRTARRLCLESTLKPRGRPRIESEITLPDQERGKELEYRILAVNKASEGQPSNTVMAVL